MWGKRERERERGCFGLSKFKRVNARPNCRWKDDIVGQQGALWTHKKSWRTGGGLLPAVEGHSLEQNRTKCKQDTRCQSAGTVTSRGLHCKSLPAIKSRCTGHVTRGHGILTRDVAKG